MKKPVIAATMRLGVVSLVAMLGGACGATHPVALPRTGIAALRPESPPTIRPDVPHPSSDFTTYIEGELIRVSIPSNWRELPGSNAVTFAPAGAYGNAGVKSVVTHGLWMGLARNDKRDLQITTDDFIDAFVLGNPRPRRTLQYTSATIGGRRGLRTVLTNVSDATGEPERIELFTTVLWDDALFYVLTVAPRDSFPEYRATFQRVVGSIQFINETEQR